MPRKVVSRELLLGLGLFYGVLTFNLGGAFWIGEIFMGMAAVFIVVPLTVVLLATLWREVTILVVLEVLK